MATTNVTLDPEQLEVTRYALAERLHRIAKAMIEDLDAYLGSEDVFHLEDANSKAEEIAQIAGLLRESVGFESVPGGGRFEVREEAS